MAGAALVTGGSSGIGLAIARMLRDEGFELTLVSRRAERVEAAAAELGAVASAANMADEEDCARVVAEHRDRFGRLDVLVNSAGVGIGGRVEDRPAKHLDMQLDVNLRGLFLVTQAAIPLLRESHGWIVNLASIAGTLPTPGLATYGATKAAVIALTRSLNEELDADGVARDRTLPGLRRHSDGGVVGHRARPDDPARGLRGGRADVPPPQPQRANPAGRDRAHGLVERRRPLEDAAPAAGGSS